MPVDLAVTEDGSLDTTVVGDFATVDGNDNVRQQITSTVYATATNYEFRPITANTVEEFRADVRDRLLDHPYVDELYEIDVVPVTDEAVTDDTLAVSIVTASSDISVTI